MTKLYTAQVNGETASSSSSSSSSSEPPLKSTSQGKTLYEILNSTPDASRSDLKRNYINLVRQTHPDALISKEDDEIDDNSPEFQEIMQAWRTLSNPLERKRYDRKLRAEAFTTKVENAMGAFGKTAGPQFLNAFENVAIPFLRRSAATTVAGFTSIGEDLANYGTTTKDANATKDGGASTEESGLGGILSNALKSSQKARKAIDCLELMEKSRELKKRAEEEQTKAQDMRDEINTSMSKRVKLTLHTPDTKIDSLEALMILDGMNTVDEVKMKDIVRFRHTVSYEIKQLQQFEKDLQSSKKLNHSLEADMDRKTLALEQARANAKAAMQAEERARKALEDAINLVASTNHDVMQSTLSLETTDDKLRYNEMELERISKGMSKQQERVRVALRRKEEAIEEASGEKLYGDFKAEKIVDSAATIQALLKEERYLRAESARLDSVAERLLSRAEKLEKTAKEIEKEEDLAWEALEESVRVAKKAAESGYGKYSD